MPKSSTSSVSDLNSRRGARAARDGAAAIRKAAAEAIAKDDEEYAKMPKGGVALDGKTGSPVAETTPPADPPEEEPADDDDDEGDSNGDESGGDAEDLVRVDPPGISAALVLDLQQALTSRKLVGLKQPLSKAILCGETHVAGGREVGCAAVAAVAIVDEQMCSECAKMKSKRLLALCVPHGALYASGEAVDPQLRFSLNVAS